MAQKRLLYQKFEKIEQFDKEIYKNIIYMRPLIINSLKNISNICSKSAFHSILQKQNEAFEINQDKVKKNKMIYYLKLLQLLLFYKKLI